MDENLPNRITGNFLEKQKIREPKSTLSPNPRQCIYIFKLEKRASKKKKKKRESFFKVYDQCSMVIRVNDIAL